jgi:hypothetical protein
MTEATARELQTVVDEWELMRRVQERAIKKAVDGVPPDAAPGTTFGDCYTAEQMNAMFLQSCQEEGILFEEYKRLQNCDWPQRIDEVCSRLGITEEGKRRLFGLEDDDEDED